MFWQRADNRGYFAPLFVGLIALAWLALILWGQSPYGRFLSHEELEDVPLGLTGDSAAVMVFFVAGWTVMTVAMMLPTSLPLFVMFQRIVRQRDNGLRLVTLLIAGYLAIWSAFGFAAHAADRVIHASVEQVGWLEQDSWMIGAGVLLLAGVYQFAPIKYACLDKCRSPFSFINEHWRGKREQVEAFRLGIHHGLFCVGCCWSLMLLMFAFGVGNVGWMLALGAVMAVEKNMPWGRRLSAPLGFALLVIGVALLALGAPDACAHPLDAASCG
jgi:predicted metal-binding membrane protein